MAQKLTAELCRDSQAALNKVIWVPLTMAHFSHSVVVLLRLPVCCVRFYRSGLVRELQWAAKHLNYEGISVLCRGLNYTAAIAYCRTKLILRDRVFWVVISS